MQTKLAQGCQLYMAICQASLMVNIHGQHLYRELNFSIHYYSDTQFELQLSVWVIFLHHQTNSMKPKTDFQLHCSKIFRDYLRHIELVNGGDSDTTAELYKNIEVPFL